jgi:hypothetical protein
MMVAPLARGGSTDATFVTQQAFTYTCIGSVANHVSQQRSRRKPSRRRSKSSAVGDVRFRQYVLAEHKKGPM